MAKKITAEVHEMLTIISEGLSEEQINESARIAFLKALKQKRITFDYHESLTDEEIYKINPNWKP